MSRGLLRNKIPQLQQALEGRVTGHHRFLLRELLDHLYFVESKMRRIEQEVEDRLRPFQGEVVRLCTIPGVDRVTAWGLLAEIGLDMKQFVGFEPYQFRYVIFLHNAGDLVAFVLGDSFG